MKKIMIDCGHYTGWNKYTCIGSKVSEGEVVWTIGQNLIPLLKEYGFEVGCTKNSIDAYPGAPGDDAIVTRGRMAKGYDLFISLHTNACGTESVNRPVVIYPVSGQYKDLAAKIGAALQDLGGWQNYQIFSKWNSAGNADYYGVIRGAASVGVPGMIIEHTFHTNKAAAAFLLDVNNCKKIAKTLADTIAAYFGATKTTPVVNNYYRVRKTWADATSQIGAYKRLESAKSVCDAHNGYYVFDGNGTIVYPTTTDDATVTPAHKSITCYTFKAAASTKVYCDTVMTNSIGSLNSGEEVSCVEAGTNLLLCWYALDNGKGYKAGYVARSAGSVY